MDRAPELRFADVESLHDLGTLVARARRVDPDGALRLQATGAVLAAWVCVLPGRGLLGEGVVLGLRVMPLAEPSPPFGAEGADLDVTVPLASVTDRLARRVSSGDVGATLPVPPTVVSPPWTALTPPRTGWEPKGTVSGEALVGAATRGIEEVAAGTPHVAGAPAVAALRERVWSVPLAAGAGGWAVPAGAGFAAYALGFVRPGETARVHRAGGWTRVSLPAGHVLAR